MILRYWFELDRSLIGGNPLIKSNQMDIGMKIFENISYSFYVYVIVFMIAVYLNS